MKIILASASPRRKELLENMGIKGFDILKPEFDESSVTAAEPGALVEALSRGKAAAAAQMCPDPDALFIAADTVVALEESVLGKPADREDACRMLRSLSGRKHHVYTGITVRRGEQSVTRHEVTAVTFRALEEAEIQNYVKTGEPMDKAGSYGIQGFGSLLVERLEGDYFNVMGLPVCLLGRILNQFGLDCMALAAE